MKSIHRYVIAVALIGGLTSCASGNWGDRDFRQDMRDFVSEISSYAKAEKSTFSIVPQNGQELVSQNGEPDGTPVSAYLDVIDGIGREDLFYGYTSDDTATPTVEREWIAPFLDTALGAGKQILVTDYCVTPSKVTDSYTQNESAGYVSFAANRRNLDEIPTVPPPLSPHNSHSGDVTTLTEAKNFLYILDSSNYPSKADYLNAIGATNYDLLIIDLFYENPGDGSFSRLQQSDIDSLRTKENGGSRLVICYMSIGEAEDYRYYWQPEWDNKRPVWMERENPDWPGNYKVRYWDPGWKSVIYGSASSYLDLIIDSGFDGVYLDIIDAFEYFE